GGAAAADDRAGAEVGRAVVEPDGAGWRRRAAGGDVGGEGHRLAGGGVGGGGGQAHRGRRGGAGGVADPFDAPAVPAAGGADPRLDLVEDVLGDALGVAGAGVAHVHDTVDDVLAGVGVVQVQGAAALASLLVGARLVEIEVLEAAAGAVPEFPVARAA